MEYATPTRRNTKLISPAMANAPAPSVIERSLDKNFPETRRFVPLCVPGASGHDPRDNHLLASLPAADLQRILPRLELVAMPLNMVVAEASSEQHYVYFPTDSIVSLQYETQEGASIETTVIGREGLVGVSCFMGGGPTQGRAIVKSAGSAFRVKATLIRELFGSSPAVQRVLLRYTQALMFQASQMAVCNRHHNVVQQLCRMLLLSLDRSPTRELFMKQEAMAAMLGVRRESVTSAAAKLQEEGLINYSRGHITINNRAGLEKRVCECYSVVKKEYDQLPCACVH
ncbi:Crp/Fnr family transcriptional regulator [soil metagenome]